MAGLGLRHGEKAGVAIAMTVFLLCVGAAVSRPTIETTPDQVKKAAEQSASNLARKEDRESILKKLEADNIKPTNFAAAVEDQIKVKLVADQYKPKREWVSPEPGAGLIRDTPLLIAPTDLYAYPGRGGLLVYQLDEEGKKIKVEEGDEKEEKQQRYGKLTRRKAGGMGGMGGMMGGQRKRKRKSQKEIEREEKEERERQSRELKGSLVGDAGKEAPKEETEKDKEDGGPYKEITKGYRWVAITGTLDHSQMVANYRTALKNPAVAHPEYARLDLERRIQQPDGTWSEWEKVDADKNLDVLDNVPEHEEEPSPASVRPDNLVDPLPFLTAGLWEKVHIASLVPKEKRELPEEPNYAGGMGSRMMRGGMMGSMGPMGGGMDQQSSRMSAMQGMMRGGMGMMGSPSMGMMGGGESAGNYWKSDEKKVMIRALDFTVKPDTTYRYRVRIVVVNPNYHRDDISPEALTLKNEKYLKGPWSKETDVVSMPPDVMPYAVASLPGGAKSDTKVSFEVIRFNPVDGWTVPHRFPAGVGEVVGDPYRESVPKSDGSGTKKEEIDFNSHQIVLDVDGGGYQDLPTGIVGPSIERPALAAMLRYDGAMVVHSQADDVGNEFRKDTAANYKHELAESDKNKKRSSSQGSGYMGMMGGMMRGGMGGMRGGRGGRGPLGSQ